MEQVSLRALTVSEVLDRALRIYRAKFIPLLGIVAFVFIPQGGLNLLFTSSLNNPRIVLLIVSIIFQNLALVALTAGISNANLGKPFTIQSAYSQGVKRLGSVIGSSFLVGLAVTIPAIAVGACLSVVRVGFLAVLLVIPIAIFLGTRWSLYSPAIVVDDIGAVAGLTRSWELTKDFFWRVFGTSFLATLLTLLLTLLPGLFVRYILGLMGVPFRLIGVADVVVQQIALIFATPFAVAVRVLIYYDLRIRKEGFDLMIRAEENQGE